MRACLAVHILILFIYSMSVFAESHHPQEFLKSIKGAPDEGEQIYNHFCVNCHAQTPLIPLGAPRINEEKEWNSRLKQGLDVLFSHTDEGYNAMPSRGGCFECTDNQLILAIIYMVPKQAQKDLLNELRDHKKYKE